MAASSEAKSVTVSADDPAAPILSSTVHSTFDKDVRITVPESVKLHRVGNESYTSDGKQVVLNYDSTKPAAALQIDDQQYTVLRAFSSGSPSSGSVLVVVERTSDSADKRLLLLEGNSVSPLDTGSLRRLHGWIESMAQSGEEPFVVDVTGNKPDYLQFGYLQSYRNWEGGAKIKANDKQVVAPSSVDGKYKLSSADSSSSFSLGFNFQLGRVDAYADADNTHALSSQVFTRGFTGTLEGTNERAVLLYSGSEGVPGSDVGAYVIKKSSTPALYEQALDFIAKQWRTAHPREDWSAQGTLQE
jgi:hypothetical protein